MLHDDMIPAFFILAANRLRLARRSWSDGWAKKIVAASFMFVAAGAAFAAYLLFFRAFRFLLADEIAGPLIIRYVLEMAFALIFLFGTASFVASFPSLVFRTDELKLLSAMPVSPFALFAYRFLAALSWSSWPVLLLGIPALTAFGAALSATGSYYAFSIIVALLFVLLIAVAGGAISFILAPFARRMQAGWFAFAWAAGAAAVAFAFVRRVIPRQLFDLFAVTDAAAAQESGARIRGLFAVLPSHPFADLVISALPSRTDGRSAAAVLLVPAVFIGFGAFALAEAARRWYQPLVQRYRETGFLARPEDAPAAVRRRAPFPRVFRWRHGFLFEKDALALARSPADLARGAFLLFMLVLYLFALRTVSRMEALRTADLYAWVLAFAFAAIGYFTLTICMRFVFPSLSLEGRSAWVLWSSPVHPHEFFSWKFFFWSGILLVVMETVALATGVFFGLAAPVAAFFVFTVACAAITLAAVTLGQGSLFPNFRDRDPDMLSTSSAGLAATGIGLVYIWILVRYTHRFVLSYLQTGLGDPLAIFGILTVSFGVAGLYWFLAMRSMNGVEFPT